jgi:hypothetical protein
VERYGERLGDALRRLLKEKRRADVDAKNVVILVTGVYP